MADRSNPIFVRVSGPLALFTRPEMKVERVSYDIITPSAARGILEAILWKPQMHWIIKRIKVLNPIRFVSVKRNEIANKIPSTACKWARENKAERDFFADDDRQQRNSLLLRDVDYVIEAIIELKEKAGPEVNIPKYLEMFKRRVEKGQRYHQPYLGCREFPAQVSLSDGNERSDAELLGQKTDLGWMLLDIEYSGGGSKQPRFFHAEMIDGVIEVKFLDLEAAS